MFSRIFNHVAGGSARRFRDSAAGLTLSGRNRLLFSALVGSDLNQGDFPDDLLGSFRQQTERCDRVSGNRLCRRHRTRRVLGASHHNFDFGARRPGPFQPPGVFMHADSSASSSISIAATAASAIGRAERTRRFGSKRLQIGNVSALTTGSARSQKTLSAGRPCEPQGRLVETSRTEKFRMRFLCANADAGA